MISVDLNADLGEYQNAQGKNRERELLSIVSSCNIACGGHAGDEESIKETLEAAMKNDVSIGAHPSYPDKEGFGRRSLVLPAEKLQESLHAQLMLFKEMLVNLGGELVHIKPHGALYNDMMQSADLSEAFLEVAMEIFPQAKIFGLPKSALEKRCNDKNIEFIPEAFVDRRYSHNGTLVPRSVEGAILETLKERVAQACKVALGEEIETIEGVPLLFTAKTICLHGDDDEALETTRKIIAAFRKQGISIRPC